MFIFFQLVFRDKPPTPPSAVAEVPVQNHNFIEAFRVMKNNTAFMLLTLGFALMFGFYLSLGNLISNLFAPFGFDPREITNIGLYLLVSGIFGAIIVGAYVDRTGTYKCTTLGLCVANIIFLTGMNQTLYHLDFSRGLFITCLILCGFSSVAYIPLSLGFGAELTFPL